LREQGQEPEICDVLDSKATEVYTACSFQDLTGQRTRKVIQVMRYLEARINAMIKIWGLGGAMAAEAAENEHAHSEAALLNGPALPGHGLDQGDIDIVMAPAEHAASAARTPAAEPSSADAAEDGTAPKVGTVPDAGTVPGSDDVSDVGDVPEGGPMTAVNKTIMPVRAEPVFMAGAEALAPPLQPAAAAAMLPTRPAEGVAVRAEAREGDPLATVTALSFEEKVALFT
jgi:chemotaxis protein CheZ